MTSMKSKPKDQLNVRVDKKTLEYLDNLINYEDINSRSDAVAYAAKFACEHKEKSKETNP